MCNIVHVDEKWLNEDVGKKTHYLLDGEEPQHRQRLPKRFIGKAVFLAADVRPMSVLFAFLLCVFWIAAHVYTLSNVL